MEDIEKEVEVEESNETFEGNRTEKDMIEEYLANGGEIEKCKTFSPSSATQEVKVKSQGPSPADNNFRNNQKHDYEKSQMKKD